MNESSPFVNDLQSLLPLSPVLIEWLGACAAFLTTIANTIPLTVASAILVMRLRYRQR